jgi:hypothetical protein
MAPILGLGEVAKSKAQEVEGADEIEDYMTIEIQEPRRTEPETSLQRRERKQHEV